MHYISEYIGRGSRAAQTNIPPTATQTPSVNKDDNSNTDNTTGITGEAGNKDDSYSVNNSDQTNSENAADDQGQEITYDAENHNSDFVNLDDTDLSNVKADDYYIGEVIESFYKWFSRAVNFSGEDAEDALNMINDMLYEADGKLTQRIKDWADAERTQIKKMSYQGYSYGDIQYTSVTELYVTADTTYEVTKQDNMVETQDIIMTFYMTEIDGEYKIIDIKKVEE